MTSDDWSILCIKSNISPFKDLEKRANLLNPIKLCVDDSNKNNSDPATTKSLWNENLFLYVLKSGNWSNLAFFFYINWIPHDTLKWIYIPELGCYLL